MKYTNKIDNAISYEGLDEEICNNIFEENLAFLKASINFLEETKDHNFLYFIVFYSNIFLSFSKIHLWKQR